MPVKGAFRQPKHLMKLSAFITTHIEQILSEWDVYARTLFAVPPPHWILRDHAREILLDLTLDMETPQSASEQLEKSWGQPAEDIDRSSAAAVHGLQRQSTGFTLIQLTSEYRALRATVLRLWLPQIAAFDATVLADVTRFHEALDQALADSVVTYSESADRTRDTFLAILGHDLRSPLFTMAMAGRYFTRPTTDTEGAQEMGARISRSAANMTAMVNDLLAYARTQLGGEIPLNRQRVNVRDTCYAAMEDAQAGHPDCPFALEASGDTVGSFDPARLQQVFSNLLNNAAQYSADTHPVTISVHGHGDEVIVQVCNRGPVIPAQSLQAIFDPLVQLAQEDGGQEGTATSSLGLGLFIAREITTAHAGTITAESNEHSGTVFTVKLPRSSSAMAS
jgi:signal transduction histidine kinase